MEDGSGPGGRRSPAIATKCFVAAGALRGLRLGGAGRLAAALCQAKQGPVDVASQTPHRALRHKFKPVIANAAKQSMLASESSTKAAPRRCTAGDQALRQVFTGTVPVCAAGV